MFQMFELLYGRHIGAHLDGFLKWRLHSKLCEFGRNTSPNNARMHYTDLNLGEIVYMSIIYIPGS